MFRVNLIAGSLGPLFSGDAISMLFELKSQFTVNLHDPLKNKKKSCKFTLQDCNHLHVIYRTFKNHLRD